MQGSAKRKQNSVITIDSWSPLNTVIVFHCQLELSITTHCLLLSSHSWTEPPIKPGLSLQASHLMRSLLEVVLASLLLPAGHILAEERYPFHPQYVEILADSPVPVQVMDRDQELPEK